MTTTVTPRSQSLVVTEVSKIQVTDIVDDAGTSVRALRIWGSDGPNLAPTIEIVVSAETAEALRITTPELMF